jgi:hypothetical protein
MHRMRPTWDMRRYSPVGESCDPPCLAATRRRTLEDAKSTTLEPGFPTHCVPGAEDEVFCR